ncbi:outer membrane lipoprotein carrier protein LolA [Geomonas sp. Red32]|uniref:outer membrane lipoprotein carrier protein LolA n=1 Tax=Geomonas sp. Red32 TaxID=2912856 RepID=UPI00202CD146|nr:outer membrane lipoprotein carrier protein LolA [Geomonas sp. Red32]MCM0083092.1 outer membrane lipoprotein carrier protein LolA [Geomonas sp. Red32]
MARLMALLALVLMTARALAAASPAVEALETLRRSFRDTAGFTADVVQEKRLSLMKKRLVSRGVVRFRTPDTFFMELYPPHASRLLLKDNLLLMHLPGQATQRVVLPPGEGLGKWFAFLSRPVNAVPEGAEVTATRQGGLWQLQLAPKGEGGVRRIAIVFDGEGRIFRVAIDERNGDRTELAFRNFRRNVPLTERDFRVE